MEGLKDFGTGFLLSAGKGLSENIKKSTEADAKAILQTTKELKAKIATNKALDSKLTAGLKSKLIGLQSAMPNAPQSLYRTIMSSDDNYKRAMSAIEGDTTKSGAWLRGMEKDYGIDDTKNVYSPRSTDNKQTTLSDLRVKTTTGPDLSKTKDSSNNWINTLLGARLDPEEVLNKSYKQISMGGRNSLSSSDLQYAYGVPSRGIASSGLPLNIRKSQKALTGVQQSAIANLQDVEKIWVNYLNNDAKQSLKVAKEDYLKKANVDSKSDATQRSFNKFSKLRNGLRQTQEARLQKIFDIISRNSVEDAKFEISKMRLPPSLEKLTIDKTIPAYQKALAKVSAKEQLTEGSMKKAMGGLSEAQKLAGILPPAFTTK